MEKIYKEFCRLRNQIRRSTRKAKKTLRKSLVKEIKQNPKKRFGDMLHQSPKPKHAFLIYTKKTKL
jgi:hypothetical protein